MAIDSYNPMNIRPLLKQHERKLIEHCFFSLQCSYTSFDAWRQSFIIRTHRITPTMVPLATTSHKISCTHRSTHTVYILLPRLTKFHAHTGARLLWFLWLPLLTKFYAHTKEHAYYVYFAITSHKILCTHRSTLTMFILPPRLTKFHAHTGARLLWLLWLPRHKPLRRELAFWNSWGTQGPFGSFNTKAFETQPADAEA
jgi:hypothetical protein